MAVVRCERGHYYDHEKFAQCPHCQNHGGQDVPTVLMDQKWIAQNYGIQYAKGGGGQQGGGASATAGAGTPVNGNGLQYAGDGRSQPAQDEEKTIGLSSRRAQGKYVAGWLVCVKGPSRGYDFRLYAGFNRIGRGLENDVVLSEDMQVSLDTHCSVVYEERKNVFYLVPKDGNFAYLNGEALEQAKELASGAVITVGESELEFIAFCQGERKWT